MFVIMQSAFLAILIFVIGVLAKNSGMASISSKGVAFITCGGFLYLFVAAIQYTLGQFISLNSTAVMIGGLVAVTGSILALFSVMVGVILAVQEISASA